MSDKHWAVEVRIDGEQVLTLETDGSIAGKADLSDADEAAVRTAAEHLKSFVGAPRTSIEIIDLREAGWDGGGLMGYWAKGHHERYAFAAAVNQYTGADHYYDQRYVNVEARNLGNIDVVRHEWWRVVPVSGEPGHSTYHNAEPHSRGAFAVTVTTIIDDRERKATQRNIDEFHKGSRSGFGDGLNWALRQLDRINAEAGEQLLKLYREKDK